MFIFQLQKLVLIFMDIDNFRFINQNYGYFVGDEVIQKLILEFCQVFRFGDIFGCVGGEEFVVYFFGVSGQDVV